MKGKATFGYASRTEAIMALRAQNLTTRQIADKIGIEPKTVSALEVSVTRSKARLPQPGEVQGRLMLLPADLAGKMRRASSSRGLSPNQLARRIVEVVVNGGLIDAVLDDRERADV